MAVSLSGRGSGDGGGRACGGEGSGAAGPGGVVGQGDDVGVGQVGGFDPFGDAAFGDEEAFAGVDGADVGGGVSGGGQVVAEDDVAAAGGGAAEGGAVAEQVAQALGDDVHAGPLGGGDDGHGGGAAACYQVAEQGDEFFLLGLGAQDGGVEGDLVDDDGDDVDAVAGADLAAAVGGEPGVPVVHDALEPLEGDDGVVEVGADEFVGDVVPHAEFDLLAVEQHQPGPGGQGGVRGQGVHQPGFAAAGLARGEQVLVNNLDVDRVAEFVDAHVDGVEHGQRRPDRDGARGKGGAGHEGFSFGRRRGNPRPAKTVGFPRV